MILDACHKGGILAVLDRAIKELLTKVQERQERLHRFGEITSRVACDTMELKLKELIILMGIQNRVLGNKMTPEDLELVCDLERNEDEKA